jgi:hypothetical protein
MSIPMNPYSHRTPLSWPLESEGVLSCDHDPHLFKHASPRLFVGHVVQRLLLEQLQHVLVPEVEARREEEGQHMVSSARDKVPTAFKVLKLPKLPKSFANAKDHTAPCICGVQISRCGGTFGAISLKSQRRPLYPQKIEPHTDDPKTLITEFNGK